MCLCNYNTGKLHDGAMAMVLKARQSPGPFGEQAMYVFRRDENLAWTGPELDRIKSRFGGGVWYRLWDHAYGGTIQSSGYGGVTLTAGDPAMVLYTGNQDQGYESVFGLSGRARVRVNGGAVAGGIFVATLQYSYTDPDVWITVDESPPLTLLADQQTDVFLTAASYARATDHVAYRLLGACTVQNVTIPSSGLRVDVDLFVTNGRP